MTVSRDVRLDVGGVVLVPLAPEHLDAMWAAIGESAVALRGTVPWWRDDQTKDDIAAWMAFAGSAWQAGTLYAFSVLDGSSGRFLGQCSLEGVDEKSRSATVSYWVRTSSVGHGVASSAARRLAAWACAELDLHRVEISMVATNAASAATARKSGAVFEGRLRNKARWRGESYDMLLFSFVPQDFGTGPAGRGDVPSD